MESRSRSDIEDFVPVSGSLADVAAVFVRVIELHLVR
jgi:hypothetical protein